MDECEIRMRCLELARTFPALDNVADVAGAAKVLERFVAMGEAPADPHAHTIDKFTGNLVVRPGYRPDLDPFSETETARMMGVV